MTIIHSQLIDSFKGGTRQLHCVMTEGTVPAMTKAGLIQTPYHPGDVILSDLEGNVIVGPVSLLGVTSLAEAILNGDQRMATDPKSLLVLAAAVVAFQVPANPSPDEPAITAALPKVFAHG